ncbi:MAG: hypothetical protein ACPGXK_10320, partial [Phycisphaerae bacterium]
VQRTLIEMHRRLREFDKAIKYLDAVDENSLSATENLLRVATRAAFRRMSQDISGALADWQWCLQHTDNQLYLTVFHLLKWETVLQKEEGIRRAFLADAKKQAEDCPEETTLCTALVDLVDGTRELEEVIGLAEGVPDQETTVYFFAGVRAILHQKSELAQEAFCNAIRRNSSQPSLEAWLAQWYLFQMQIDECATE